MNKHIEEMAKFMLEKSNSANATPIFTAEDGTEIVLGENATKLLDTILEQAFIPFLAECLVKEGYRKTYAVAREIFDEIEEAFDPTVTALFCIGEILVDVSKSHISEEDAIEKIREYLSGTICSKYRLRKMLAELRKKYESEGADDD